MAVEDILKKIESDAREAALAIVAEMEREAETVLDGARTKAAREKERLKARAEQRAAEERNRIMTLAKLSARRDLLSEKQRLIDEVFAGAREKMIALGRDDYRRAMRAYLIDNVESGDEEVVVAEGDDRIDQAFLDEVSREIGRGGGLRLSKERRPIGGGFVLVSGRTEVNCALDTILRAARERLETEVAGILFPEESGS